MKIRAFAFTVLLVSAIFASAQDVTRWQGKKLPNVKMTSITGRKITNRTLKGKVVIIDFWATWCGPCKAASPVMQKMHAKYGNRGLVVIGANVFEDPQKKDLAKKYAHEHKYTYTFTVNNDAFAKALGITGIPTMLIVDKKGNIARVVVGYDGGLEAMLDKTIAKLL
jgi:thiol-disulfide isomerase/thioredoxin